VGYFDVPADKPTVIEFVSRVEAHKGSIEIAPYGLGKEVTQTPGKAAKYKGAGLAVHWVEVEGPLYNAWPPASHRRIFGDRQQVRLKNSDRLEVVSKNPKADAESIIRDLARRAFRRPVTEDELKPFLALVRARLEALLNCWVMDTKATRWRSKVSIILAKSSNERLNLSTL
jgi:hypothetical protein